MDEDRCAFRHHRAVGLHERRNLRERIHTGQFVEARTRLPRRCLDHAKRNVREDERRLDGGGTRALAAVKFIHRHHFMLAIRRSISSGDTSSTCVATVHTWPNGSASVPLLSP